MRRLQKASLMCVMVLLTGQVCAQEALAPDGRTLAFVSRGAGAPPQVVLASVGTSFSTVFAPGFGVRTLTYSDDGKTLFIEQDSEGGTRLTAWDVATKTAREVKGPADAGRTAVVLVSPRQPLNVLVARGGGETSAGDLFTVDTTLKLQRVAKNPGDVVAWFSDLDLVPRLAIAKTDAGRTQLRTGAADGGAWKLFGDFGAEENVRVLGLGTQGRTAFIASRFMVAGERLVEKSLLTGAERELGRWPGFDGNIGMHPVRRVVQWLPGEDGGVRVIDSSAAADWAELSSRCPEGFDLLSRDRADLVWRVVCRRRGGSERFVWSRSEKREMPPR